MEQSSAPALSDRERAIRQEWKLSGRLSNYYLDERDNAAADHVVTLRDMATNIEIGAEAYVALVLESEFEPEERWIAVFDRCERAGYLTSGGLR